MKKSILFVIVLICMSTIAKSRAATPDWKQQFAKVTDEYFDQVYFHYAPQRERWPASTNTTRSSKTFRAQPSTPKSPR